jgi:hypothetical protein
MGAVWSFLLDWLVCLFIAFITALLFLRHVWAALLVSLGPLPGMALATVLCVLLFGWSENFHGAFALSFAAGLLLAGKFLRMQISEGGDWKAVVWASAGVCATSLGLQSVTFQIINLTPFSTTSLFLAPVIMFLAGMASGLGLILYGWRRLSFDEGFFARANRAMETRTRLMETAAQIAAPRWALALSGAAVVTATLGWFEIERPPVDLIPIAVLLGVTGLLTRDWRAVLAAGVCAGLLCLLWADQGLVFFALPAMLLAAAVRRRAEEGTEAWHLVAEEEGAGLLFAAVGIMLIIMLPHLHLSLALGAALLTALIFFPAFNVALWTIFPRHRSVEELYRG